MNRKKLVQLLANSMASYFGYDDREPSEVHDHLADDIMYAYEDGELE